MSYQLFYLFSAVLLGLVIGALIMYFSSGSNRKSEKSIAKMEKKLNNYQNEVAEHFEQTANLVDDMTQSYKKVFDHLGKSARLLMTDEQIQEQIKKRKGNKVILEYLTNDQDDAVEEKSNNSIENISAVAQLPEDFQQSNVVDKSDADEISSTEEDLSTQLDSIEELANKKT